MIETLMSHGDSSSRSDCDRLSTANLVAEYGFPPPMARMPAIELACTIRLLLGHRDQPKVVHLKVPAGVVNLQELDGGRPDDPGVVHQTDQRELLAGQVELCS